MEITRLQSELNRLFSGILENQRVALATAAAWDPNADVLPSPEGPETDSSQISSDTSISPDGSDDAPDLTGHFVGCIRVRFNDNGKARDAERLRF